MPRWIRRAVLLALLVAATLAGDQVAHAQTGPWTELPPMRRENAVAAYDSVGDRIFIVSSFTDVVVVDASDPATLTRLTPAFTPLPSVVGEHVIGVAYDQRRNRLWAVSVAYEGYRFHGLEVWWLDAGAGTAWHAAGQTGPGVEGMSVTLDTRGDRLLLYGGVYNLVLAGSFSVDTFLAFDLSSEAWSSPPAPASAGPHDRYGQGAVYDPARNRYVVFDGARFNGYTVTPLADVWALDMSTATWDSLSIMGPPPATRAGVDVGWDPDHSIAVMVGGTTPDLSSPTTWHDTWTLSFPSDTSAAWTKVGADLPQLRDSACTAYDTRRHRVIARGGSAADDFGRYDLYDGWSLPIDGSTGWQRFGAPTDSPRTPVAYGLVRSNGDVLASDVVGDPRLFRWRSDAPVWAAYPALPFADPRYKTPNFGYDPQRDRAIALFNEHSGSPVVVALQDLSTGAWTYPDVQGRPAGVGSPAGVVYDPVRDRTLLLGLWKYTSTTSTPQTDVAVVSFTDDAHGTWSTASVPTPHPPTDARFTMPLVDPVTRRVLVLDATTSVPTVWTVPLDEPFTWTHVVPAGPGPRGVVSWAIDPDLRRIVVLATDGQQYPVANTFWTLNLGAPASWVPWSIPVPPEPAYGALLVDRPHDRMVIAGGRIYTHALDSSTPVAYAVARVVAFTDRIELHWYSTVGTGADVERRERGGPWVRVGRAEPSGTDDLAFIDRAVAAGTEYAYRLVLAGGATAGETTVRVPGASPLAIEAIAPSPARDRVRFTVSLPAAGAASLEIFDATGRRVDAQPLAAGTTTVTWARPQATRAGVYFARLTQAGRTVTRRLALLD